MTHVPHRRLRLASVTLVLLAATAGCKKQSPPPTGAGAPASDNAAKGYKIALIAKSSTIPVFLAARAGAEDAAKALSAKIGVPIEIAWLTPPQEDGQLQAQRIQQAVNEGANAVLLSCSDAGKVTGAINDAVSRGVEVMTFDSDAAQSKRFAFYGADDLKFGAALLAEMATQLGGKGKIAILAGNQNAPNLRRRVEGVQAEAKKHPGLSIVGTFHHVETPQDGAAEVIRAGNAYPDITGWIFVGGWPLWTKSLLTDLDPKRVKIVSADGLPAQLPYVDKGLAPVLLAQPCYDWGRVGVETIIDKIHFKKPVPSFIPMELVRVTKDNLFAWAKQLKDWGLGDVPPEYLK